MTALPQRIRRFEVRYRQPETDSMAIPVTCNRGILEVEETPEPYETGRSDRDAIDPGDEQRRFVRQPVKILLVPRNRLVR